MRISHRGRFRTKATRQVIETPSWRIEFGDNAYRFTSGHQTVVVEGEVFYSRDSADTPAAFAGSDDVAARLKRIYESVGHAAFANHVEGNYNVAVIDTAQDTVSVSGDPFNRVSIFYCAGTDCPILSTDLSDLLTSLRKVEYDPAVLYCILILGYPPAKHTPYRGLRRIAIGERVVLRDGAVQLIPAEPKPLLVEEMGEADLDRYGEILDNAVLSRSSQTENWIELSGWDSTVILAILRRHWDASKVRAVTLGTKWSDGSSFYVVPEAPDIGRHFGVPVEFVEYSLDGPEVAHRWRNELQQWLAHFLYDLPVGNQVMADVIRREGKAGAAAYIGSFSDSLHDFAFSHYGSLPYVNRAFREYTGKMRAYLYSPAFLRNVLDGSFGEDFVYKLFRWHCAEVPFTDVAAASRKDRVLEYLLSFVLSGIRLPFASIATDGMFSREGVAYFKEWLTEHYFGEAVEGLTPETMYFWLIRLYQHFHLQGYERNMASLCFEGSGKRACQPYYDLRFVEFAQRMPDGWGRGLELVPAKWALKAYGRRIGVPYERLEALAHLSGGEAGARSNIARSMLSPALAEAARAGAKGGKGAVGQLFDHTWFSVEAIESALDGGHTGGPAIPLRLWMMLSDGHLRLDGTTESRLP